MAEDVVLIRVDGDGLPAGVDDLHPRVFPVEGEGQVQVKESSSFVNVHDAPEVLVVNKQHK